MNRKGVLGCVAVLGMAMASGAALADQRDPGFYIGAGVGAANLEIDDIDFDDSDTAFKLFGGYRFNEYFGVELAYFDNGTAEQDLFPGTLEIESKGVNASAVVTAPFGENLSVFAKLGYASIDLEAAIRGLGQRIDLGDDTEEELSYGAGLTYSFNEAWSLRAEYEAFDLDDADADQATVSVVFRF